MRVIESELRSGDLTSYFKDRRNTVYAIFRRAGDGRGSLVDNDNTTQQLNASTRKAKRAGVSGNFWAVDSAGAKACSCGDGIEDASPDRRHLGILQGCKRTTDVIARTRPRRAREPLGRPVQSLPKP